MPYATNDSLPKAVRAKLSAHQQDVFRNVFNSMMNQDGMDESRAFAGAWAQAKKGPKVKKSLSIEVVKFNDEQHLIYGWAYVTKQDGEISYDHSGEWVSSDTLEQAATKFMLEQRVGKAMHSGDKVSDVVHSLPVTKELKDALGIQSNREGWIIAQKIHDPETWARVKSGELPAFSIGGRAVKGSK